MPLYEYECTVCHRRTEKIQKFSDPELVICPFCAGRLERTITAAAVSFKGGGWFKDGYGSVKPPANAGEAGAPAAAAESGAPTPPAASGDSATPAVASTPAPAPAAAAAPAPASAGKP